MRRCTVCKEDLIRRPTEKVWAFAKRKTCPKCKGQARAARVNYFGAVLSVNQIAMIEGVATSKIKKGLRNGTLAGAAIIPCAIAEHIRKGLASAAKRGAAIGRPRIPGPDPVEVRRLRAAGQSWRQIAVELGCDRYIARRRAKMPVKFERPRGTGLDGGLVHALHAVGRSWDEIAIELGCSVGRVHRCAKAHGMTVAIGRPRGPGPEPVEVFQLRAGGRSWRQIAAELGCTRSAARRCTGFEK